MRYTRRKEARARPHATRTVDIHSDHAASSHSLALVHLLAPLAFARSKERGRQEDGKIVGDQFWRAEKKCASKHLRFFSVCIRLAKKMSPLNGTDTYSTNKNILLYSI